MIPARAAMLLLALEVREDCTSPELTAEAFSATSTVIKSFTRLARSSRARSVSNAEEDHSDPGDESLAARAAVSASAT